MKVSVAAQLIHQSDPVFLFLIFIPISPPDCISCFQGEFLPLKTRQNSMNN